MEYLVTALIHLLNIIALNKKISELSREEIARLFPVTLTAYQENWPRLFEEERQRIQAALGEQLALRIEHFGSTAVPGMTAKDTIDMLLEIPAGSGYTEQLVEHMKTLGYDSLWQQDGNPPYLVFVKGYTDESGQAPPFHVHAGPAEHPIWDRLYFRDYLRAFPAVAQQYEKLKQELAEKYRYDRVAYRIAKTAFVTGITAKAKALALGK